MEVNTEIANLVSSTVKGELTGEPPVTKIPVPPPPKGLEEATPPVETKPAVKEAPKAEEPPKTLTVPDEILGTPGEPPAPKKEEEAQPPPGSKEANLAQLRKRAEDQQKIIDELNAFKAGILGEDGKVKPPPELATALKERDEEIKRLSETLERENFVKSPRFTTEYQKPIDDAFARVVAVVKEFGGDEQIAQTLALSGLKDRAQILKDRFPDARDFLAPALVRVDELLLARQHAIDNHKVEATRLQEKSVVETQEQVRALRSAMKDKALATLEGEGHFVFREIPGNEEWNSKVAQFKHAVETVINSNDIEVQTEALALSVAAPVYKQLFQEERAARMALEKRLAQMGVAKVSPGGGAPSSHTPSRGTLEQFTPASVANAIVGNLLS